MSDQHQKLKKDINIVELAELATKLLQEGHTIVIREEANGTLEITAFPLETLPHPNRPIKERPVGRGKGASMSPNDLQKIKDMKSNGITHHEIANKTGWSISTINRRLCRFNTK